MTTLVCYHGSSLSQMPEKPRFKRPYASISLFSGAMGLDLGLEQEGFKVKVAVEINRAAIATIGQNRPGIKIIDRSITDVCTTDILKAADLSASDVTLVSAGPCCQSFSTAGKRHSVGDPRGSLFLDFCRIVREVRPRFFAMENVRGILSAAVKHRPLNERGAGFPPLSKEEQLGSALELIQKELASLGYYVVFGVLNAADFGVPQQRYRVFFLGSRDGEDLQFPAPSHASPEDAEERGLEHWLTLRDGVRGVKAKHWAKFGSDRLRLLKKLKPGQNWKNLPERFHRDALGAAADSWGGRSGFCRRLAWNKPAPTLTTAPDGRATTLCHPRANRPLSVEEYAALQQFPADWKFSGSVRQQYTQIGNAVPVGLGSAIGRALREAMLRTSANGLPEDASERLGHVICADPELEKQLKNRRKTQLHPARLRKIKDPEETRQWLEASA